MPLAVWERRVVGAASTVRGFAAAARDVFGLKKQLLDAIAYVLYDQGEPLP